MLGNTDANTVQNYAMTRLHTYLHVNVVEIYENTHENI